MRLAAAEALKHMAAQMDTASMASVFAYIESNLPSEAASSHYLQISYELHLALVRATPRQFAILFGLTPGAITNRIACEV